MTGRVAIVTGGTGALGQSVTSRFLSAGATVWIPYVVPAEVEALKARVGAGASLHCAHADVTDETAFGRFVQSVLDAHGRVDILINGVGGFAGGDLVSTRLVEWDRMLTLNLRSAVLSTFRPGPSCPPSGGSSAIPSPRPPSSRSRRRSLAKLPAASP
jgi:NAD(P)-dependent dehydrogenase (short-subunit alcohol dehydrogenase family)